ncbi:MAG: right-handed parallel beta-helix repeat-containing protein [Thermoplasmata archaeon]|nr:right-handed parallel beta-helix repeat-containing protein [Thermoplasmata archaeon]
MKRGSLVIIFLMIVSVFSATVSIITENAMATTLYVGGAGPGNYTVIQDAVDAAQPGDTVFVYNGTYYENVRVYKTLNLTGENRDTTIINASEVGDVIHVTDDWVNVTGFTVENSGQAVQGHDSGIKLDSVQNCYVAFNRGIYNWRSISMFFAGNNVVVNNTVLNYKMGISLEDSTHNVVVGNTIFNGRFGIFMFRAPNNTLENNALIGSGISLHGFDSVDYWNTHTIDTSNTVNGKPVYYWNNVNGGTIPAGAGQVILANSSGITVENQNLDNGTVGLLLGYSSNNLIANNSASSNEWLGLVFYSSVNNTITNNTVLRATQDGIWLRSSDYNSVTNNNVSWNTQSGISISFSDHNSLVDNTVLFNQDNGVNIQSSNNNNISQNRISNLQRGLSVTSSNYNTMSENIIVSNGWEGIHLSGSVYNNISNNNISYNTHGFYLRSSILNNISNNNILYNTIQAYDDGNSTQWDFGYPTGGNYWSDYGGTDNKSGPNQDQPGGDGIGDTPYVIDGDSLDRYPFMYPFGQTPRPPTDVAAVLSGGGFEDVTLIWTLSADDGAGSHNADGYRVYRSTSYDSSGSGYVLRASFPNGTTGFVDTLAGEGNPNTYFYLVCVVDQNNDTRCTEDQVAKFIRPLSRGLNLVSIPLIQSDETAQRVIQTISYDNAWSYDPINQEWKSFSKSKPYAQSLEYLSHTIGIWVNVTQDTNLTIAGVVPTSTTIDLQAGWNLVGFPSFDHDFSVADLKAAVAVEGIEGFDGLAPPSFLRVMTDGDFLQAGFGYWVRVQSPAVWTVENT